MKNRTIARRYAKALLMIGQQDGQAERYRAELQAVAGLVAGEPRLHQAITNPLYESSARRRVLETHRALRFRHWIEAHCSRRGRDSVQPLQG